MKRLFFIGCLFFLTACAGKEMREICPFNAFGRTYVVDYSYNRVETNPAALEYIRDLAGTAAQNGKRVCIVGKTGHALPAQNDLYLSLSRAKALAEIFYDAGVPENGLYVIVQPQNEPAGLSVPDNPAVTKRQAVVLIEE